MAVPYCAQCQGEYVWGERLYETHVSWASDPERIDFYCIECGDYAFSCMWDEEELGPYPTRMQYRRGESGRA